MDLCVQTARFSGNAATHKSYGALNLSLKKSVEKGIQYTSIHGNPQDAGGLPSMDSHALRDPHSRRILIVDDTFSSRRLAELILKNQGYFVGVASNGREAVELAKAHSWDIILMDLQMPIMNGWQATQAIRQREKEMGVRHPVPIVALSAYSISGNRERSLEIGMNDFLAKPINPTLLIQLVEKHGCRKSETPQVKDKA